MLCQANIFLYSGYNWGNTCSTGLGAARYAPHALITNGTIKYELFLCHDIDLYSQKKTSRIRIGRRARDPLIL